MSISLLFLFLEATDHPAHQALILKEVWISSSYHAVVGNDDTVPVLVDSGITTPIDQNHQPHLSTHDVQPMQLRFHFFHLFDRTATTIPLS
jgi:hypothetical protein